MGVCYPVTHMIVLFLVHLITDLTDRKRIKQSAGSRPSAEEEIYVTDRKQPYGRAQLRGRARTFGNLSLTLTPCASSRLLNHTMSLKYTH